MEITVASASELKKRLEKLSFPASVQAPILERAGETMTCTHFVEMLFLAITRSDLSVEKVGRLLGRYKELIAALVPDKALYKEVLELWEVLRAA